MELLRRTFAIDLEICARCSGRTKIIALVKDPEGIARFLRHLGEPSEPPPLSPLAHRRTSRAPPPPPDSRKGKKPDNRSPEKDLVTALLAPVEDSRQLMQVVLTLPKAHVRVLDTEAAMLGLRRYPFVELLFLSELGQAILTRPSYMQSYPFVRREIDETQRVLIYFRPEVKKLFEEHLARQGQRPSSWVAMALRNWAQLDEALRAVK